MLRRMAIAALLAGALVGLTFAQPPAGGRRGQGGQPPGPPTGAPMMFARGGPMMMLGLLRSPQVQQELKITEEQRTKLEQLGEQLREKFRGLGQELRGLPPEEREKRIESLNAEVEKELAKVLDEKQLKRLKQIALQVEGYAALARPSVAKEVGLTEGQLKQILEILREANEKRRALFQQGPPADPQARFQEMQKIRQWVEEQIGKLLTEQQKKKWQQLIGEPFKFEFRPFGGGRPQQ
ncbi:MAG: hypothetical protein N3B10_14375 [Armatimonadetes bacterium]|nr:hypothetical protein [Armatimonadota bacterium]MCX7969656.1 hypothetical protein [Armatimonadota bacterium]MDW8144501.1 hypothetical protein [Armatimonadota bacterium]